MLFTNENRGILMYKTTVPDVLFHLHTADSLSVCSNNIPGVRVIPNTIEISSFNLFFYSLGTRRIKAVWTQFLEFSRMV